MKRLVRPCPFGLCEQDTPTTQLCGLCRADYVRRLSEEQRAYNMRGWDTSAKNALDDHHYEMTQQEVADELGVTRERVRQIENNALAKIARSTWCRKQFEGWI